MNLKLGILFCSLAWMMMVPAFAQPAGPEKPVSPPATHRTQTIEGWTLHISQKLLDKQPAETAKALELLRGQLAQIIKVVPPAAAGRLQKVPLWFSPALYKGTPPRAEYHVSADWLRENHRDPIMEKSVEFTNIAIFERECERMPVFVLHELAHAFHDQVLGYDNVEVIAAWEQAKKSGSYDNVEQWTGRLKVKGQRAYALTNPMEYFSETSEAFFGKNDFQPFDRAELKKMDPGMEALLERLWNTK